MALLGAVMVRTLAADSEVNASLSQDFGDEKLLLKVLLPEASHVGRQLQSLFVMSFNEQIVAHNIDGQLFRFEVGDWKTNFERTVFGYDH